MVTFEEFTLRAYLGMEDAARNAAINAMWARLIGEQEHVVPLWPEGCVPNYTEDYLPQLPPSLSLFLPEGDAPRGLVIVCSGGGYAIKAPFEGFSAARKLCEMGFAAAVLDYRVRPYTQRDAICDIQRAIRVARYHAEDWHVLPDKIAVMGFSAGGHLSGMAACYFDAGDPESADPIERMSSRPDAAVLCYGAHSRTAFPEPGFFTASPFRDPDRAEKVYLSVEKNLRPDSPPFFLWQTNQQDDPRHIMRMGIELTDRGIPFEMHCFPMGNHGLGLADGDNEASCRIEHVMHWIELLGEWLEHQGF